MNFPRALFIVTLLAGLLTSGLIRAQEQTMDQRFVDAEKIYRSEGAAQALPEFLRLLELFENSGEIRNTAIAQGYIGACHWRLGNSPNS